MKRSALALVVALAIPLAGCAADGGGTGENGDGKPSILMWVDATREPGARQYAELVADEVDVTVEVIGQGDVITKITLANQTNSGWPDVVFAPPNDIATLSEPGNGFAAPLDDLVDPEILDGYGVANDWCVINGVTYCLKNDLAQTVLWYDTVVFEELGLQVPTTMDEFATEAMKLQGTGYTAGPIGDLSFYSMFLQTSGCPLAAVEDPTTVRIDVEAEECTRVAELVQPLVDAGVLDTRGAFDAGFISEVAQAGRVAMVIGPSWYGDHVFKPEESWAIPAGRISAAPTPSWAGDEVRSGQYGGAVWAVSSHSNHTDAAVDAAVWMATSEENQSTAVTYPAYGPVTDVWGARLASDGYYADDIFPVLVEAAESLATHDKPVRYNIDAAVNEVLATRIVAREPISAAIDALGQELEQLAMTTGYTVTQ